MKNPLDISSIPARFVYFWWLRPLSKNYDDLIISEEQVSLFGGMGDQAWDLYRGLPIFVKDHIGIRTMQEYKRGTASSKCWGGAGSKTLHVKKVIESQRNEGERI